MTKFSTGKSHIPECAQLGKESCTAMKSLHGEGVTEHWWSGWPGAYCLKCGSEDVNEICLAGCECPCHAAFWKEYEETQ